MHEECQTLTLALKPLVTPAREYPARAKANLLSKYGRLKTTDDPGGVGSEIVREI